MAVLCSRVIMKLALLLLYVLVLLSETGGGRASQVEKRESAFLNPIENEEPEDHGTRWAVLVAGSNGWDNYRHQADVCHAYQLLRRGGLKDENIVVFMYDDIAMNESNPRPGVIINNPHGDDVYAGVPKDYTGKNVTVENLYAVLLGNNSAVKGGSGKVVDSKPSDRIFVYYADHGGPGILGMPNKPLLFAKDFIDVLEKKHASGSYEEMVIYVEACESGSIFDGILPKNLSIYVTTTSNPKESSWATYCDDSTPPPPPPEFNDTCLGDFYSVAWMEDSDTHNLMKETIGKQYWRVKKRTSNGKTYELGSHVMEYGNKSIKAEKLCLYQGFDPDSQNYTQSRVHFETPMGVVSQRDADIHSLWRRYQKTEDGSEKKTEMLKQLVGTMKHRNHLDDSTKLIGTLLYGPQKGFSILNSVRSPGLPIVDDWGCLKSMVRLFETHCGSLTQYGMKHMRAFANICNSGVSQASVEEACMAVCGGYDPGQWHPSILGYSA